MTRLLATWANEKQIYMAPRLIVQSIVGFFSSIAMNENYSFPPNNVHALSNELCS